MAIYQAPQSAYDIFDKVLVLYEGRQIFFGRATEAKDFFLRLGFDCPARQTDADFLTSMTSAIERVVRPGWEDRVPRTPDEFAKAWRESSNYARLQEEIREFDAAHTIGGESAEAFKASRTAQQSKRARSGSPYTLSFGGQVGLCLERGFQRLRSDPAITVTQLVANSIMALIVSRSALKTQLYLSTC